MFDTIVRGGTVVDGSGSAAYPADIAIANGRIAEVGQIRAPGRQVIDADGALVTPGFIDVHTHLDGQFIWDDRLDPAFSHGVTTAIAGNCGVGFAPVQPDQRKALIELMEGVEEIPGIVLEEGLDWGWRSFPDYLDRLAARSYAIDVASHVTHAPLRVFVMGERALRHEPATPEDIAEMARLVREAMDAGAIGFSGARVLEHVSSKGDHVPGTFASDDELLGIARAMGESGHGTFQIIPLGANGETYATSKEDANAKTRRAEHDRIARIAEASGRPVTYLLLQFRSDPDDWRMMIAESEQSLRAGCQVYPQVGSRGIGALTTLDGYHYFMMRRSYHEVAHLPLAKRVIALREPAYRAAILSEVNDPALVARDPKLAAFLEMLSPRMGGVYPMTGQSLDYEPGPERRLSTLAAAAGVSMEEYVYDHYTSGDGTNLCASFVLNYAEENLNATYEMLRRPIVAAALGDAGAHVRMMCDASWPTFQLAFWARDRKRGPTLPLEHVVNKLTKNNADLYGLRDRGVIAPGLRADLNVIDHQRLKLHLPRMTFDLPSGGGRMLQTSSGYLATLVGGEVTRRHDVDTGAPPGRLVRSGRAQ
jgi:N-acyl-D-amino-acid deacylase